MHVNSKQLAHVFLAYPYARVFYGNLCKMGLGLPGVVITIIISNFGPGSPYPREG